MLDPMDGALDTQAVSTQDSGPDSYWDDDFTTPVKDDLVDLAPDGEHLPSAFDLGDPTTGPHDDLGGPVPDDLAATTITDPVPDDLQPTVLDTAVPDDFTGPVPDDLEPTTLDAPVLDDFTGPVPDDFTGHVPDDLEPTALDAPIPDDFTGHVPDELRTTVLDTPVPDDLQATTLDTSAPDDVLLDAAFTPAAEDSEALIPRPDKLADSSLSKAARADFDGLRDVYADWLDVGPQGQVHHAIELQVLDRFPDAFTADELNDFDNMRGIPRELTGEDLDASLAAQGAGHPGDGPVPTPVDPDQYLSETVDSTKKQLHNSAIRDAWDRAYVDLQEQLDRKGLEAGTPEHAQFARTHLENTRDQIDHTYGQFFSENRAQVFGTKYIRDA